MKFFHRDGLALLGEYAHDAEAVFFVDPPYTAGKNGKRAGSRLYAYNELDHEQLFELVSQLKGDFLMTYENTQEVRDLAALCGLDMRLVPMKNTHHTSMMELLIGRNWLQHSQPE